MKKILISEAEKAKILGMHYNAMGKSLVNEQNEIPWNDQIMDNTGLSSIGPLTSKDIEMGQFEVTFVTKVGGEKRFSYQCITDPRKKEGEGGFKMGTLRDYDNEVIVDPKTAGLKGDWLNYVKQYCKPAYTWLAEYKAKNAPQPQAQVAGAEAQSMNTNAMETQKNTVKSLLLRSPFLMPEEQDFESLKKDVTEVINTLKSSGFDVLKVHKLPEEYFPLYERMYDVAKKWPELYDVPGPYPYSLRGFIHKSGKENNWKGRQKL